MRQLLKKIPEKIKNTAYVRLFGLVKVPLIFWVRPTVLQMDDNIVKVKIPLNRRTKNHLNSMYFGVLATGADVSGALLAMNKIQKSKRNISLAFKDFKADFLKRAHGDVHFVNTQGNELSELIEKVIETKERQNHSLYIEAFVPSESETEPVAKFWLTLSLKLKD